MQKSKQITKKKNLNVNLFLAIVQRYKTHQTFNRTVIKKESEE